MKLATDEELPELEKSSELGITETREMPFLEENEICFLDFLGKNFTLTLTLNKRKDIKTPQESTSNLMLRNNSFELRGRFQGQTLVQAQTRL